MSIGQQITISLTKEQIRLLDEMSEISGKDRADVIKASIEVLHQKILDDEDLRQKVKLNSFLSVLN